MNRKFFFTIFRDMIDHVLKIGLEATAVTIICLDGKIMKEVHQWTLGIMYHSEIPLTPKFLVSYNASIC